MPFRISSELKRKVSEVEDKDIVDNLHSKLIETLNRVKRTLLVTLYVTELDLHLVLFDIL